MRSHRQPEGSLLPAQQCPWADFLGHVEWGEPAAQELPSTKFLTSSAVFGRR